MLPELQHRSRWVLFKWHVRTIAWNTYLQFLMWIFLYGIISGSGTTWESKDPHVAAIQQAVSITICMALMAVYTRWLVLANSEAPLYPLMPLTRSLEIRRTARSHTGTLFLFYILVPLGLFLGTRKLIPTSGLNATERTLLSLSYLLNLWFTLILLLLVELYEHLRGIRRWTVLFFAFRAVPAKVAYGAFLVLFVMHAVHDPRFAAPASRLVGLLWTKLTEANDALLTVPMIGHIATFLLVPVAGLVNAAHTSKAVSTLPLSWSFTGGLAIACAVCARLVRDAIQATDNCAKHAQYDGPPHPVTGRFNNAFGLSRPSHDQPPTNPATAAIPYLRNSTPEQLCVRLGSRSIWFSRNWIFGLFVFFIAGGLHDATYTVASFVTGATILLGGVRLVSAYQRLPISLGHKTPILYPLRTLALLREILIYRWSRRLLEYLVLFACMWFVKFSIHGSVLAIAAVELCYLFGALLALLESYRTAGNWQQMWILVPVMVVSVPIVLLCSIMTATSKLAQDQNLYIAWVSFGMAIPLFTSALLLMHNIAVRGEQLPGMTPDARLDREA